MLGMEMTVFIWFDIFVMTRMQPNKLQGNNILNRWNHKVKEPWGQKKLWCVHSKKQTGYSGGGDQKLQHWVKVNLKAIAVHRKKFGFYSSGSGEPFEGSFKQNYNIISDLKKLFFVFMWRSCVVLLGELEWWWRPVRVCCSSLGLWLHW